MSDFSKKVCLIIPCFNEEKRLQMSVFEDFSSNCFILFVNDGSEDNTLKVIKSHIQNSSGQNMYLLNLEKNVGKGEAVRQGMLFLKKQDIFNQLEWVGYWDADLATPLEELYNFMEYKKTYNMDIDSVWGSRVYKLGSKIKRRFIRHLLGRMFATAIGTVLKVECYDSQCGAKIFKKKLIDAAFSESFISRWIFDVEILLRLKDYNIIECPLRKWEDVEGGKAKIFRAGITALIEIFKIRKRYLA